MAKKIDPRIKRKFRIRKKIAGTTNKPRLSVFKSLNHVYAQIIDDSNGTTIAQASSLKDGKKSGNVEAAKAVGQMIAERAKAKQIENVIFDRNGFIYHGVVKALADSAREAGLKF